ncbi:ABC transporter permease [Acuticoccus kandeliae]|uniref:ABC transporter permease n=1 Tax=Acuticoccus kandeliae TaxID=2073160 RepID=UPI001300A5E8|nr:ABC transporter permease [Acuticoccus kandeliae]
MSDDTTSLDDPFRVRAARLATAATPFLAVALAILLAAAVSALLILLAGANPVTAFGAIWQGAFGTPRRIASGFAKATPYLLCGVGIALCFRARIINIGGEGQIALGGLGATWLALAVPLATPWLAIPFALVAGAAFGLLWASLAAVLHVTRRVHEVLVTLLLNFVAILLVSQALHGAIGEVGAGFPQSALLPQAFWLPKILPNTDLHIGILIAVVLAIAAHVLLWRTSFGFSIRLLGASRRATNYAGYSPDRITYLVMAIAGALAGLAGAIQVLGIHLRLIEGYSDGLGFVSVAIALLGGINPLGLIPASLFFGFLEVGALSMQRQMGVPSSLVSVMEGITMLFILAAMAHSGRKGQV